MPWTPDDIPDQHGRVAVVTGANSGLGLATARELARKGAHVVMAVRDQARAKDAHAAIEADPNTDLQARSVRETGGGLSQRFWHAGARYVGMSPDHGAHPQLRAATDPGASGGELYTPMWVTFGPAVRRPVLSPRVSPSACRTLWEVSERETGERFDVAALVDQDA